MGSRPYDVGMEDSGGSVGTRYMGESLESPEPSVCGQCVCDFPVSHSPARRRLSTTGTVGVPTTSRDVIDPGKVGRQIMWWGLGRNWVCHPECFDGGLPSVDSRYNRDVTFWSTRMTKAGPNPGETHSMLCTPSMGLWTVWSGTGGVGTLRVTRKGVMCVWSFPVSSGTLFFLHWFSDPKVVCWGFSPSLKL